MTAKATKGTAGNTEGQWRSGYGVKVSIDTIVKRVTSHCAHGAWQGMGLHINPRTGNAREIHDASDPPRPTYQGPARSIPPIAMELQGDFARAIGDVKAPVRGSGSALGGGFWCSAAIPQHQPRPIPGRLTPLAQLAFAKKPGGGWGGFWGHPKPSLPPRIITKTPAFRVPVFWVLRGPRRAPNSIFAAIPAGVLPPRGAVGGRGPTKRARGSLWAHAQCGLLDPIIIDHTQAGIPIRRFIVGC